MKRNRKSFKTLLTLALAYSLCFGTTMTALAAPSSDDNVKIKKVLEMPHGTTTPSGNFEFEFTAVEYNNTGSTTVNNAAMPLPGTAGIITINYAGTEDDGGSAPGGVKKASVESAKIFDGVTWTAPGVYTYTVAEKVNTFTLGSDESMTYDPATYTVEAWVENHPTLAGQFVIKGIAVSKNGTGGGKVTVTPGINNGFVFTNIYSKTAGGSNPLDNPGLTVSNAVATSPFADYSKYFEFNIVTAQALPCKAYLIENGVVISPATDNGVTVSGTDTYGGYVEVAPSGTLNIKLKNGQSVAFVKMAVGTSYTATQTGTANYKGAISMLVDNSPINVPAGAFGASVTTGPQLLSANTNSAAFTNTVDETNITPTGLSTNDFPFVIMIVLAAVALVVFVVVKSRKKANSNT